MIDHLTVLVRDYKKSRDFYLKALAPLGYELVMELSKEMIPMLPCDFTCGLGVNKKPDLWLRPATELTPAHVAFACKTRAEVDAFYRAAIEAGGKSNGEPGPRPHYHPAYYGAFVFDPDGYNIEAVCHTAE